jgi:hypothetical protein
VYRCGKRIKKEENKTTKNKGAVITPSVSF